MIKAPKMFGNVELTLKGRVKPETDAERLLLEAVKTGEPAIIPGDSEPTDPSSWTEAQTIRADFIRHICLNPDKYDVDPRGIHINNVKISGTLDLSFTTLNMPLAILASRFVQEPNMTQCTLPAFNFSQSFLPGLNAGGLTCSGSVFLINIKVQGQVRLTVARIRGNLSCNGAEFNNVGEVALSADGLTCGGTVLLHNIKVEGTVRLIGAKIEAALFCDGAIFKNINGDAFIAQRLNVTGRLFWQNFSTAPEGVIDFRHAHVGDFINDGTGWPDTNLLEIEGFTFDNLSLASNAETLINWLNLMPYSSKTFSPQPYEHMVKVLRNSGHEHDAREIAIEKQEAYGRYLERKINAFKKTEFSDGKPPVSLYNGSRFYRKRAWLGFSKWTIGYGYRPWLTLAWLIGIIVVGTGIFKLADTTDYMHIAKERVYMDATYIESRELPPEYPEFNSFVYAVDVLIPFVDLHQENYWEPKAEGFWGGALRFYFWFQITAGWVLASMAAAGLTGLIKKD